VWFVNSAILGDSTKDVARSETNSNSNFQLTVSGVNCCRCTADAEVARAIMVKHFKVFPDRSMFYPPQDPTVSAVLATGITFAK